MTKLSEFIPIEYIKKSEKLQGLKVFKRHYNVCHDMGFMPGAYAGECKYEYIPLSESESELFDENNTYSYLSQNSEELPAPTIADIIDNAEELFGCSPICQGKTFDKIIVERIITMCQQNKPIEEVSDYILDNLK